MFCLTVVLGGVLLSQFASAQGVAKPMPGPGFAVLPPITNADPAIRVPLVIHVPTRLSIQRVTGGLYTNDSLAVEIERSSLEATNLMVGTNMITGVESRYFVYPEGEARPARGGFALGGTDFNLGTSIWHAKPDGLPLPGKKYVVELELTVFETAIPPQHEWDPHGKNYKVLWQRTLKQKAPDADTFMVNIFKKIEKELPELGSLGVTTGNSSPGETWGGVEFAAGGFFLTNHIRYLPGVQGKWPMTDLNVTIHRYAFPAEELPDLESGLFRNRQASPDSKTNYKGAVLYRWSCCGQPAVCQAGLYVIEIQPGEGATSLVMKVLDVMLRELDADTPKSK